jgi:hypothetical protein
MEEQNQTEKQLKGYKVIVIVLAVVLAALTFFYVSQIGTLRDSRAIVTEQRDTLMSQLSTMIVDFDQLQTENDTINASLQIERHRDDSLMQRMQQERNWNAARVRDLQKELGSLRLVMQGYVRQIDSLNTLATTLANENVQIRREINTERLRADMAEERADELDVKVRRGAVILARGIRLLALNNNDREMTRASRSSRLRTDFTLTANELAQPGPRDVYVRIVGPDGYVMADAANSTFEADGERMSYSAMRTVDYQNVDLPVSVYYNGGGIVTGTYAVTVYLDGQVIGSNEIILK